MSLFDLQDVCIAIGSLATLDLPMVVDLIGIYGLKGPYCMLTTTNWFLQALSVIPRGSWGDVARRFTMIRWANVPRVKKTPVEKAVSRKRPAAVDETIVNKKKRTSVGKAAAVATDSTLEALPVQVVAPISTVPPPTPKRKIQKRKRRLALGSDDEIVGEPPTVAIELAAENIVEEQRVQMPVDPVDQIIEQVIAETAQVETDVGRTDDSGPDECATREANRPVETGSDTEEEFVTEKVTATYVGVQTETGSDVFLLETSSEQTEFFQGTETAISAPTADKNISDDESMTLEAILSTISDGLSLPSTFGEITPILLGKSISIIGVEEGDWYKASLPKINPADKGKVPLQERDPVKGNPVKEQFLLIVADIGLLVQLSPAAQNEAFRGLFKSIRQEAQNDNTALSLALKVVRTQNAILSTDLAATQKEVKDLQAALSKNFDDKLADIRNDLLEFRVETQAQLASLGTHLAELIAFITKGSDDKKGEGSSSGPQPPPDDQNRPSGGSGSRADDPSRYGGVTVSREGGNRSGDGRRRGDSSGSSKRRRSDSGGEYGGRINYGTYLPPKRDAEYWISGKRQF
ncbi:hypothetical protein F511_35942 [Dorcoceras hygrometricum]|uniref:Uncharacterized protein n=1 Tax=Dorcoceras hygrometricum TaxID=472368 RepID=A0A2Z7BBB6_9LAMI|nr:hypothetical protein F511_35942 [Dorcoceras hygrometricum]